MITGKEAKQAWANGENVQIECAGEFFDIADHREFLNVFDDPANKFRLKPRTITINGIEVPAPFEPKHRDNYWYVCLDNYCGYEVGKYTKIIKESIEFFNSRNQLGAWRTEEEIKQVVAALRSVFK